MSSPAFKPDEGFAFLNERPRPVVSKPKVEAPEIQSVASLMAEHIEPPRWVVDRILPEGLTLLVSPPKAGKSFLIGNVAWAAASGGLAMSGIRATGCGVLFLDLEQSKWFAQERWSQILCGATPPHRLHVAFRWPRMDSGGLDALSNAIKSYQGGIGLVIIDVLSQFWPLSIGNRSVNAYHAEYQILCKLRDFAADHRIALVTVHHTNRGESKDPLDRASGTNAMTGVPGAIWTLTRERKAVTGKLYVTGRNVREHEIDLNWQPEIGGWSVCYTEPMPL